MTTPPDTLARLKQLHEAATPGPWEHETDDTFTGIRGPRISPEVKGGWAIAPEFCKENDGRMPKDMDLIAELRNALPGILADLQKMSDVEDIIRRMAEMPEYDQDDAHRLRYAARNALKILTRQPS